GVTAALLPREAAFERVRDAMHSGSRTPGVERGVVILAPDGEPVAWAGRHRFVPARDTAELRAVITPFYVSLEARRQTQGGGSVVHGPRADRLLPAHGGAVLPRAVLPLHARGVQRVGRRPHGARRGGALRRQRAVAAGARAALVERRRRGRAGARGAVPRALSRPRHRAAGGRRGVRVVDVVGGGRRHRRDGSGSHRGGAAVRGAVPLLERHGRDPPAEAPRTPGDLYAWWLASPLAEDDYPASLALWTPAGEPEAEIRLASVDLPPSLMAALVRSPETA